MNKFKKVTVAFNLNGKRHAEKNLRKSFPKKDFSFSQEIEIPESVILVSQLEESMLGPKFNILREDGTLICYLWLNVAEDYIQIRHSKHHYLTIHFRKDHFVGIKNETAKDPKKDWGLKITEDGWSFSERIPISYKKVFSQEISLPEKWNCLIDKDYDVPVWNVFDEKNTLILKLYLQIQKGDQFLRAEWKNKKISSAFMYFIYKKPSKKEEYLFFENGTDPWGLTLNKNGYYFLQ